MHSGCIAMGGSFLGYYSKLCFAARLLTSLGLARSASEACRVAHTNVISGKQVLAGVYFRYFTFGHGGNMRFVIFCCACVLGIGVAHAEKAFYITAFAPEDTKEASVVVKPLD